jgi:VanZ family protein
LIQQKFVKYWLPVIIWMCFIFWMSTDTFSSENTSKVIGPVLHLIFPSFSAETLDIIHGLIRKSAHVVEYFVLGLLLFRAFRSDSPQPWDRRWAIYAVIVIALYAMSDEFHQISVPSRTGSIFDIGLDTAGGILSQIAIMLRLTVLNK